MQIGAGNPFINVLTAAFLTPRSQGTLMLHWLLLLTGLPVSPKRLSLLPFLTGQQRRIHGFNRP